MSKKSILWILLALAAVGAFFGYQYWQQMPSTLPKGIASGNGRVEAKLVDISLFLLSNISALNDTLADLARTESFEL